ncbi:hypothetical protein UNDYM_4902 [Undibacterium sp. YM2]|uniref:hypothetical protein n=1 Tax=Undibacterium sp. YM2 TaxID=2058625 RepID=UPI001331F65C|nr:hypothetical protein [Undibacterium sp. YM2]BBB69155.1 hypothetical protein UNDYM_4902 [Undibacterium sp. YM2]
MMQSNKNLILSSLAAAMLLSACGGSNNNTVATTPATPTPVNGVFLDAAVDGLEYSVAGGSKQNTSATGGFNCNVGDTVAFSVGGIGIGSAPCATTITPLTLANSSNVKDDSVVNRLLFLQLLDEDNDVATGIKIPATVKTALAGQALDFNANAANFNTALTATLAKLPANYQKLTVDADRRTLVREHFEDTMASRLGTPVVDTVTQTNALGTVSAAVTRYQIQAADNFFVPYEGSNAAVKAEFPKGFLPSYGSGLTFKGKAADGSLEFYGITDRGPNGDGPKCQILS